MMPSGAADAGRTAAIIVAVAIGAVLCPRCAAILRMQGLHQSLHEGSECLRRVLR